MLIDWRLVLPLGLLLLGLFVISSLTISAGIKERYRAGFAVKINKGYTLSYWQDLSILTCVGVSYSELILIFGVSTATGLSNFVLGLFGGGRFISGCFSIWTRENGISVPPDNSVSDITPAVCVSFSPCAAYMSLPVVESKLNVHLFSVDLQAVFSVNDQGRFYDCPGLVLWPFDGGPVAERHCHVRTLPAGHCCLF